MEMNDEKRAKEVQKMLSKLIADEWFAGNMYKQFAVAVEPNSRAQVAETLLSVADDELNDHLKSLVEYALQNGFKVPTAYNEMKKLADAPDVKAFESCKVGEEALHYIDLSIASEERAIETYEKYVDIDWLREIPELDMIIKNNYYDEQDHLEKFNFIKSTIEAMKQFNG